MPNRNEVDLRNFAFYRITQAHRANKNADSHKECVNLSLFWFCLSFSCCNRKICCIRTSTSVESFERTSPGEEISKSSGFQKPKHRFPTWPKRQISRIFGLFKCQNVTWTAENLHRQRWQIGRFSELLNTVLTAKKT